MSVPPIDKKTIEKLYSKKASEREAARRELERLGPNAVDVLLELLEDEDRVRKKRRNIGIGVIAVVVCLMVVMAATHSGANIGSFTGVFTSIAALFAATAVQKNAARVLAEYDDIRAVGRIAEALEYDDKNVVEQAMTALTRMLPRLRASDWELLTTEQRRILDRALLKNRRAELSLAILSAYEQVGDELSVPVVERIATGEVRRVRDQRIVQRAADVLPAMRLSARRVRDRQTLLRPADEADDSTLLRPASGPPAGPTETLLRPFEDASSEATADTASETGEEVQRLEQAT